MISAPDPAVHLPFDPIERAGELWESHFGDPRAMMAVTSVMRVQQLLIQSLDAALKSFGITFARYEVLVLLTFSRQGALPLNKIGERLMVHPTSVTNAIDRLEAQGLVIRRSDATDRRRIIAEITAKGRVLTSQATHVLTQQDFGLEAVPPEDVDQLFALLRGVRCAAGDFPCPSTSAP